MRPHDRMLERDIRAADIEPSLGSAVALALLIAIHNRCSQPQQYNVIDHVAF